VRRPGVGYEHPELGDGGGVVGGANTGVVQRSSSHGKPVTVDTVSSFGVRFNCGGRRCPSGSVESAV
jgi:hypothetical protein